MNSLCAESGTTVDTTPGGRGVEQTGCDSWHGHDGDLGAVSRGACLAASPLLTTPDTSGHSHTMGQVNNHTRPKLGELSAPREGRKPRPPLPIWPQLRAPAPHPLTRAPQGPRLPGPAHPRVSGPGPVGPRAQHSVYVRLGCAHPLSTELRPVGAPQQSRPQDYQVPTGHTPC